MNFHEFIRKEYPSMTLPHGVTLADLEGDYGHDPDWQKVRDDPRWLYHLAETIHFRRLQEWGETPPTFTALRECKECGPVFLEEWNPPIVAGCPWCFNRAKGLPVGVANG